MNYVEQYPNNKLATQHAFQPYEMNGGSSVAIAGDDFVVIAADTRLSSGFSIHTRNQSKLFELSQHTVLASLGCWCDTIALTSLVSQQMQIYKQNHLNTMSTKAVAQMLSIMMYNRRYFPYYTMNILGGLDEDGKGVVYSYDPVGHCEKALYRAAGTAGTLLQPVLDNQIGLNNMQLSEDMRPILTVDRARKVALDTFISAAERDIYTGDSVRYAVITKEGIKYDQMPLRKD